MTSFPPSRGIPHFLPQGKRLEGFFHHNISLPICTPTGKAHDLNLDSQDSFSQDSLKMESLFQQQWILRLSWSLSSHSRHKSVAPSILFLNHILRLSSHSLIQQYPSNQCPFYTIFARVCFCGFPRGNPNWYTSPKKFKPDLYDIQCKGNKRRSWLSGKFGAVSKDLS